MKAENKDTFVRGKVGEFAETKGYFIGRFMGEKGRPDLETEEVEIAWKKLPAGYDEKTPHYHKGGVEINIVVSGSYTVEIDREKITLGKEDFLVVYPETVAQHIFSKEGVEIIVVKAPSLPDDKFEAKTKK